MLIRRHQRRHNIKTTLGQRLVFAGRSHDRVKSLSHCHDYIYQRAGRLTLTARESILDVRI